MSHDLHHDFGNADARIGGAMPLGPAHALAALLLEDADLRAARFAVDNRHHLGVGDVGCAGEDLAAVCFDEQDLFDRQLLTRFADGSVDGDKAARGHLGLTAAVLDDRVHVRHLCKSISLPLNPSGAAIQAGGGYFRSTRVPLIRCELKALRNVGTIRSISSKYEESAGVF